MRISDWSSDVCSSDLSVNHLHRQLGKSARCRTEHDPAAVGEVERRLVARAEQVVRLPLVERDRATHVGADLGVGHDALDGPVLAALAVLEVFGLQDRKRVVEGKGVSVRVDPGGSRILKNTKKIETTHMSK